MRSCFDNLTLPREALLGETGQAFRYAQLRLAPARLTHCMRWLGAAARAQDIAVDYARTRTSFGKTIGEHQGVSSCSPTTRLRCINAASPSGTPAG